MRTQTALRAFPATLRELRPAVSAIWSQSERLAHISGDLQFSTHELDDSPRDLDGAQPMPTSGRVRALPGRRLPVMLVHGYGGSPAVWTPLRAALVEAGFTTIESAHYNALATDVPDVGARIATRAAELALGEGVTGVHLVGHSLGGLIARFAVHCDSLAAQAKTLVTIATPHAGSPLARWGIGHCARRMRPGSSWLADLGGNRLPGQTRWVNYYSDVDLVVPKRSAWVDAPDVHNIHIAGRGHLAITSYPHLVASIVSQLVLSELRDSIDPSTTTPTARSWEPALMAVAA